jgi:hypothetical protein
VRVEVTADPLDVEVNALELIVDLARVMPEYYKRTFLAGDLPEGGAAPRNKKGQPMGVGSGTIATNWETSSPSGDARAASFTTAPYQEGGRQPRERRGRGRGADRRGHLEGRRSGGGAVTCLRGEL